MSDLPTGPGAIETSLPIERPPVKVNSPAEAEALAPGTWFLDPAGVKHQRPYDVKSPTDVPRMVPEGSFFRDPTGTVRQRPETEPLDVGAQILYSMAGDPARQKQALSYIYGEDAVRDTPEGILVRTEDGKWLRPGKGVGGSVLGFGARVAAPAVMSGAGAALGAGVGAVSGPGAAATAALGGGTGMVAGEAFNDLILGLFGISSKEEETRARMDEAALLGAGGEVLGHAAGSVVRPLYEAGRDLMKQGATLSEVGPRVARWALGADPEALKRATALGREGIIAPPSAYLHEAPYWRKVIEEFDPVFRAGPKNPLIASREAYYEAQSKKLGEQLGVQRAERYLDPTKGVDIEEVGNLVTARIAGDLKSKNDALGKAIADRRAALTTELTGKAAEQESTLSILQAASKDLEETAQKAVDDGFANIGREVAAAENRLRLGEHPSMAWQTVGEKLNAIELAFKAKAGSGYTAAHAAAGPTPLFQAPIVQEAQAYLDSLPKDFQNQFPELAEKFSLISTPRGTGVLDASGEEIMAIPDITLEQAHNLRSWAASKVNFDVPFSDQINGAKEHLYGMMQRWMHDPRQPAAVRAGVAEIDRWDRYYARNAIKFNQEAAQTIIKKMKMGLMEDAPALTKLVFDTDSTLNRETMRKLMGPSLWRDLMKVDMKRVIDTSKDNFGKLDGQRLSKAVLDRIQAGVWKPGDLEADTLRLAKELAAVQGKPEALEALPGDTVGILLQRAKSLQEEIKVKAEYDPLGLLREEGAKLDKELAGGSRDIQREIEQSPLGFALSTGANEAARKILGNPDLLNAAAESFGPKSSEMDLIRAKYVEMLLSGGGVKQILKIPESIQNLMFPGVTKDEAVLFAKNVDFLEGAGMSFGGSLAAASRVLNPLAELHKMGSKPAALLGKIPGGETMGRIILGKYYALLTKLGTSQKLKEWMVQGLEGTTEERETVREAYRRMTEKVTSFDPATGRARIAGRMTDQEIGGHVGRTLAATRAGGGTATAPSERRRYQPPPRRPSDETLRSIQ